MAIDFKQIRREMRISRYSVQLDDLAVELDIRRTSAGVVTSVKDATTGETYWLAKRAFWTRDAHAIFVMLPRQAALAIVDRGQRGTIRRVIPLADIVRPRPSNPAVTGLLKQAVAAAIGREPSFTTEERKLLGLNRAEEARAVLERAEKETERLLLLKKEKECRASDERLRARKKRVEQVLHRLPVTAYVTGATDRRQCRIGLPITSQELEELLYDLPIGRRLVLVSSNGAPFGAFKLARAKDGTVSRVDVVAVTATPTAKQGTRDADGHRTVLVESRKSCRRLHVHLFSDMCALRAIRPKLLSGTRVAVPVNGKTVEVYAIQNGGGMTTVGHCDIIGA